MTINFDGVEIKYATHEEDEEELPESDQIVQKNILRLFLVED